MSHRLFLSLAMLISSAAVIAQQDPAAKSLLDKFTDRAESSYPVEIHFNYTYESQADDESRSETGTVLINKERFRLKMNSMEVYCDGVTFWNFLPQQNEVYISDPEDASGQDDFLLSDPSRIFTFYDENFKYRYNGEGQADGTAVYEIDLFPFDLEKPYHTIRLRINTDSYQLVSIQTFEKQGVIHTISVTGYSTDKNLNEEAFVFHPELYPDIEIVDTRF